MVKLVVDGDAVLDDIVAARGADLAKKVEVVCPAVHLVILLENTRLLVLFGFGVSEKKEGGNGKET